MSLLAELGYTPKNILPVARFHYAASHSHPVRRTVVLIESTKKYLKGYELREGNEVRSFARAKIKTYRRDKIAKVCQLDSRLSPRRNDPSSCKSTLVRLPLWDLIERGA